MTSLDIIASVSIRLSGEMLDRARLRELGSSVRGVELNDGAELLGGVSIDFGPTRDWRSVSRVMRELLTALVRNRGSFRFSESEVSIFMASPEETTWYFSVEEIKLLSDIQAAVFVRVLDTSKGTDAKSA